MMAKSGRAGTAGFTVIELLLVTVILGILFAIALLAVMHSMEKARQRATMSDMRVISTAIETYAAAQSLPPSDAGGIDAVVSALTPYHSVALPTRDHWSHPYAYRSDGTGGYTIESFGKDGLDAGDITLGTRFDFDLDIVLADGVFVAAPE